MRELNADPKTAGAAITPLDPSDERVKVQGGPLDRPGTEAEEASGRNGGPKPLDDPNETPMSESS